MDNEWDWRLTDRALDELDSLQPRDQDRIINKLDDVVGNEWREPPDFLEQLEGAPHHKLRIGQFRLGCRIDRQLRVLFILRIQKRGGDAYRGDD